MCTVCNQLKYPNYAIKQYLKNHDHIFMCILQLGQKLSMYIYQKENTTTVSLSSCYITDTLTNKSEHEVGIFKALILRKLWTLAHTIR